MHAEHGLRLRRRKHRGRYLEPQLEPEIAQHQRIAKGTMPGIARKVVALHHRVQIVARVLRKQASRKFHGAQRRGGKVHADATKLSTQERVIEARIVRHEDRAAQLVEHGRGERGKRGAAATISLLMPVKATM